MFITFFANKLLEAKKCSKQGIKLAKFCNISAFYHSISGHTANNAFQVNSARRHCSVITKNGGGIRTDNPEVDAKSHIHY
jgi:hypothetical protein